MGTPQESGLKVLYRRFDIGRQQWDSPIYLSAGARPRLAVSPKGTVLVVWEDDGLRLARLRPGDGSAPRVERLSRAGAAASFGSLAPAPDGTLLAAWQQLEADDSPQVYVTRLPLD